MVFLREGLPVPLGTSKSRGLGDDSRDQRPITHALTLHLFTNRVP